MEGIIIMAGWRREEARKTSPHPNPLPLRERARVRGFRQTSRAYRDLPHSEYSPQGEAPLSYPA